MSIGAINNQDSAYTGLPASNVRNEQDLPAAGAEKNEPEGIELKAERGDGISDGEQNRPLTVPPDEYIRGDGKTENSPGIYRLETDENGNQTIAFERPDAAENGQQQNAVDETVEFQTPETDSTEEDRELALIREKLKPEEEGPSPQKGDKKGGMWCTTNTDRVDAEIKQAKEKVQQIEQKLQRASDEDERKSLEAQLSQASAEVRAKDNDGYRKANATVTFSKEKPPGA